MKQTSWPVTESLLARYKKWFFLCGAALLCWWMIARNTAYTYAPGELIRSVPRQTELSSVKGSIMKEGFAITPLYEFDLKARVLGKERYRSDHTARISPYDLALGWGVMSDQRTLDVLSIRQGHRFYAYSWGPGAGVSGNAIATSSANMHMIPATEDVEDVLGEVREGDIVQLFGYLVQVITPEGGTWRSSTTRDDRGNGACEIVYVEKIEIITAEYSPL